MLNRKYFERVLTREVSDYKYVIYRTLGSQVILFSKQEHKPLLSLQIIPEDENIDALICKNSEGQNFNFQGIVTKDNCVFSFLVTNLTENTLGFDIKNAQGESINKINILYPCESYVMDSNQCEDSTKLVLSSLNKDKDTTSEIKTTNAKIPLSGTVYTVEVYPKKNTCDTKYFVKPFISRFYNDLVCTYWRCVKTFCVRHTKTYLNKAERKIHNTENKVKKPHIQYNDTEQIVSFKNMSTFGDSIELLTFDRHNSNEQNNSVVGTVLRGDEIGTVGRYVNVDIDESLVQSMKIGLLINDDLIFNRDYYKHMSDDNFRMYMRQATEHMNLIIDGKYILEIAKVYTSDICVACNSKTDKVSTVFYCCGHKCCCTDCSDKLKECPLCKTVITATLAIS